MKRRTHTTVRPMLGLAALAAAAAILGDWATTSAEAAPRRQSGLGRIAIEESLIVQTDTIHRQSADQAQTAGDTAPSEAVSPPDSKPDDTYRIGPGDVLAFRMFNDESLSGPVEVRYDGYISLPIIADLLVAGDTREGATERIREAYTVEFNDPRISLSVSQSRSKIFFLMGDINRPNEYPYTRPITLLDAINIGGGLHITTQGGDSFVGAQGQLTKALIIRHVEGERQVLSFDLSRLQESGSHASDTPVIPGDIVYVPEAVNLVYLLGEVRRPSVFQLTQDMTLLQLLTRAGGVIETTGKMRRVIIMREIDENETRIDLVNVKTILSTGLDPRLLAGDIIYVPRKRLVRLSTFVAQFTSSISPILNLYKNAYDTYFTPQRFRRLFRDDDAAGGLLEAQQVLRDVTALTTGIP